MLPGTPERRSFDYIRNYTVDRLICGFDLRRRCGQDRVLCLFVCWI